MQFLDNINFVSFIVHRHANVLIQYGIFILVIFISTFAIGIVLRRFGVSQKKTENEKLEKETSKRLSFSILILMYILMIAQIWWFRNYSIFQREWLFTANGYPALYTVMRVIHGLWLWVFASAVGMLALRRLLHKQPLSMLIGAVPASLVSTFTGLALIRIFMLPLGLVGLLYLELIALMMVIALWFARTDIVRLYRDLFIRLSNIAAATNPLRFIISLILIAVVIVGLFDVALFNIAYINNDNGDYITHYGPYYDFVLSNHSILPNDVWYQFFYSKGEGVGFLSMMLTDRLGKQLSAYVCFVLAVAASFDLMRKEFKSSLWALAGAAVIVSIFSIDDSGSFEKHHAVVAAIFVAIVYSAYHLFEAQEAASRIWHISGLVSILSLVIISIPSVAYAWITLGGIILISLLNKQKRRALDFSLWIGASGILIIIVLTTNYLLTGLPEITPFVAWLKYLNIEKFANWVSPHLIDYMVQGSSGFESGDIETRLRGALSALRLEKIVDRAILGGWYAFLLMLTATVFFIIKSRKRPEEFGKLLFMSSFLSIGVVLGYFAINQPVSVYRASGFSAFFVTPLVFFILIYIVRQFIARQMRLFVISVLVSIAAIKVVIASNMINPQRLDARLSFITGQKSLAEAYAIEFGIPPELYNARFKYGENSKWLYLRAINQAGLAHFIGRGIETEVSYSLGPNWHIIAYGDALDAKLELKRQGFNYFLVQIDEPTFGAIPFSKLFQPQTLAQQMRVVDRFGSFVLLTWRDSQNEKIDDITALFRTEWSRTLNNAPFRDLYYRSRYVYLMKETNGEDVLNINKLSPVQGWQ